MKAKAVHICIFTKQPASAGGSYSVELLPTSERTLYQAASDAAVKVFQQYGMEGTTLSVCDANAATFQQFLKGVSLPYPFVAIAGTFPDGSTRFYTTRTASAILNSLRSMWTGEFGGSGIPNNPGDGDGGWGDGDSILCRVFPAVCALGFLPWLALAAFTTYRAAEARSTTGRLVWGVPAFLFWQGFVAKGGVKQIQWWINK